MRGLLLAGRALVLAKVAPLVRAWAGRVSDGWADVAASAQLRFWGRWWQPTEHQGAKSRFRRRSRPRADVQSFNGWVWFTGSQSLLLLSQGPGFNVAADFTAGWPDGPQYSGIDPVGHRRPHCRRVAMELNPLRNFMLNLARPFGKCQNQVPEAQPAWHIPMTGSIPPTTRVNH